MASGGKLTVLPDPLYPTIRVNGVLKWIASRRVLSNDRMLDLILDKPLSLLDIGFAYPCMASWSIFALKDSAERRLRMEPSHAERLECNESETYTYAKVSLMLVKFSVGD